MSELHIAVLPVPIGTHAAPLLAVVRGLSAAAPAAKFSFLGTPSSNAGLTFFASTQAQSNAIRPYNVWDWDGSPDWHATSDDLHVTPKPFVVVAAESFRDGIVGAERESGVRVSCLLSDAMWSWFAADLAAEMGVPWVGFWVGGSWSLSAHLYTDEIRNTLMGMSGTWKTGDDQTLHFIPGLSAFHSNDLPEGILHGNLESHMAYALHNMEKNLPRATAVILNSFEELDPTITNDLKSKLPNVVHVGPSALSSVPQLISDENGCLLWLDQHKIASVVYIAFGSIHISPPDEVRALAETLEASKVPFLWSLRDQSRNFLPEGFLETTKAFGKLVPWAPQLQVLAHLSVGVFVTHCGWNSVLESITGGVPMICRPFFADQMLNSRMVKDVWQIGVEVEGRIFTKSGLTSALKLVLSHEEGRKMTENIGVLKQSAIEAVGPNGSSTANFETLVKVIKNCNRT